MKPQKRAKTPSLPAPDAAKTKERRLPTPPPHPPLRTGEFAGADIVEMGDEFIEEAVDAAGAEPPVVAVSATAERTIPAPLTTDMHGDTEEVRYRRATLVSPISAQLAESMVSIAESSLPGRDPAAPLMQGDDVTRRVVDSDHRDVINETGPGYTVEVLDDSAAAARRRVDLSHALEAAPDQAAAIGPLHRVAFLTRNPEETLARPLPHGAEALVEHIDGQRTLEQLFGDSGLHPREALRITAALLRDGIIRIV